MGILTNPKILLAARCLQLAASIVFLGLLAYSNENPSYWIDLQGPVALGVISFIATLLLCAWSIWQIYKKSFNIERKIFRILRVVIEFVILLMWAGTVALMFRPRRWDEDGVWFYEPPHVQWHAGAAFAILEIVTFVVTLVITAREMFAGGGGGGATSASYV